MTNAKILQRIRVLYEAGDIDAEKLMGYVAAGLLSAAEAKRVQEDKTP